MRDFLAAYIAAALVNLAVLLMMPPLLIIVYPAAGIVLSRFIGRRIIWWQFAANVQNISSVKLRLILTWPVAVPVFIVKVSIAKFL